MMEYDRARLKQSAKQAIKFQRPHPMLVTLLFIVIVNFGSRIVNAVLGAASGLNTLSAIYAQEFLESMDAEWAIQYALLSFGPQRLALALFVGGFVAGIITSLWSGLMRTGYSGFCLDMVRGKQPQTGALFDPFPQWTGVLLTQFLAGLFRGLWAALFGVCAAVLLVIFALLFFDLPVMLIILMTVVYIAMLVCIVWFTLRYAMVDFLIADQGLTGMDAIRESKRMMRDHIGRLFGLRLSFIGWYLIEIGIVLTISGLTLVSMGSVIDAATDVVGIPTGAFGLLGFGFIGIIALIVISIFNLWLTPYITGSEALFYDHLRGVDSTPAGGYGFGPTGGWGQPQSPNQPQHFDYTWTPGPTSGTGIGPGPRDGGDPPKPPKPRSRKDDPWD